MGKMNIFPSALDLRLDWVGLCQGRLDLDCKQITFAEIRPDNGNEVTQLKRVEPYKRLPPCSCLYRQITHPSGS